MFADLLLRKGTVITVDKKASVVDAVAIKGNKILFAGTTEDANAFINESTTVVDLHGRTVTPGFIDSHIHSAVMGVNALAIDCRPSVISSISDLQKSIYERAKITHAQGGGEALQAPGLGDTGGDGGLAPGANPQGVNGLGVLDGFGDHAVKAGEGR